MSGDKGTVKSDVMFEAVMTDLPAGLAFLDCDLRFVRLNGLMAQMNGIAIEGHAGRTPMELLPGLHPDSYLPQLQAALAGDVMRNVEVNVSTPAREEGVWAQSFHPVRDGGRIVGVMVIATDVTDERAARRSAAGAARRLAQLHAISEAGLTYQRVDELLDELVSRTRNLLGGDTATLLLDEGRRGVLRVRAAAGLDDADRAQVAVPVGAGVAGTVAASGRPMVVLDLSDVPVVSQYLREYGLRSLVAHPLVVEGRVIGVLHVASRRVAAFHEDDAALLAAAAARAALVVDRATAYEHQRVVAETLQRSLLPNRLPQLPGVRLAAHYQPSGAGLAVGGDWYDVQPLPDGRVALVIGDVVGHGIEAAALMGQLRTALRAHLADGHTPSSALARLDELVTNAGDETIATAVVGLLTPHDGAVTLAVAGHPPPLLRNPDNTVTMIEQHCGPMLGLGSREWPEQTTRLAAGGVLLLYTDGLIERRGSDLQAGIDQVMQALAGCRDQPEECVAKLFDATAQNLSHPSDDVAILLAGRPAAD